MARKFPKTLYVKIEEADKESYFVAYDAPRDLAEMGEKIKFAVYTLTEIKEVEGVPAIRSVSKRQ